MIRIVAAVADMTREQVISLYEKSVPTWRANPDLIHKSFLYEEQARWRRLSLEKYRSGKARP
jgi:hypothetical protein